MITNCIYCEGLLTKCQITMKRKFCSRACFHAAFKGVNTFKGGNGQEPLPYMAEYAAFLVPLGYVMDTHFVYGPRPGRATYKLDFALIDAKIDIELDGGSHRGAKLKRDAERDAWLRSLGWHVIRIDLRRRNKTAEEMAISHVERGKKISLGKRGKGTGPMPEHRRLALIGRRKGIKTGPLSVERRENLRLKNLGKRHTEATKAKMRASQIARQQREKEKRAQNE